MNEKSFQNAADVSGEVPNSQQPAVIPVSEIEPLIVLVRGRRVMLDVDLARLYGVSTKRLNEQVKRNRGRFPEDFLLKLNLDEWRELVANCDRFKMLKHSSVLPNAFTEHGAVMLANILRSRRAVDMSVSVVRAFIRLREVVLRNHEFAKKLQELDRRIALHDRAIQSLFSAIRALTAPPPVQKRKIGFDLG